MMLDKTIKFMEVKLWQQNIVRYVELKCTILSADDAALIWGSRGRDEDYTFGYLEEDLEEEL